MTDMTTCEPCALRQAGDTNRAEAIESIRTQRVMLSLLNGAPDAIAEILIEFGDCHDCTRRLAARYIFATAQCLVTMVGSPEAAARAVGNGLIGDIDSLDSD